MDPTRRIILPGEPEPTPDLAGKKIIAGGDAPSPMAKSAAGPGDTLVAFYCPRCRREFGIGRSKLRPGIPINCGWCHVGDKVKVQLVRDPTAEGAGHAFEEPKNPKTPL